MNTTNQGETVLLIGNGKLVASIYMCLINAGHDVDLYSDNPGEATGRIKLHLASGREKAAVEVGCKHFEELGNNSREACYRIAIIITAEDLLEKITYLQKAEKNIHYNTTVAVNTESIALSTLQKNTAFPSRIVGANWTEPAHTTFFLEIISNQYNSPELIRDFFQLSKTWQKDPYILSHDNGIRARLMCAMIREAFYLVEHGYVTVDDIDRACRNDAGFYLPFAGNFRYMDLMGTYMYGIVMKDLNPELCNTHHIPEFFKNIVEHDGEGMANNQGIYPYQNGDTQKWDEVFRTFSYQIQDIIQKYTPVVDNDEIHSPVLITSLNE